jgi:peptidyl-prolyl cis-trans isomerase SurA
VAFSLAEGEISAPLKLILDFILYIFKKIKGQELELRHILLTPTVTDDVLNETKRK